MKKKKRKQTKGGRDRGGEGGGGRNPSLAFQRQHWDFLLFSDKLHFPVEEVTKLSPFFPWAEIVWVCAVEAAASSHKMAMRYRSLSFVCVGGWITKEYHLAYKQWSAEWTNGKDISCICNRKRFDWCSINNGMSDAIYGCQSKHWWIFIFGSSPVVAFTQDAIWCCNELYASLVLVG